MLQPIVHGAGHGMHQRQALPLVHLIMQEVAASVEPSIPLVKHSQGLETVREAQRMGEGVPAREGFLRQNVGLQQSKR